MTMTLIETKTLGTAAASITFTSIPQDGTDLVISTSARSSNTDTEVLMTFNSQTTNRSERGLQGTGSSVISFTSTVLRAGLANRSNQTANTFGNSICYIPNYSGATAKSVSVDGVAENNATAADLQIVAGLWNNTAAITSIQLTIQGSGNFTIGSTVSLYKITKGSSGGVVVS